MATYVNNYQRCNSDPISASARVDYAANCGTSIIFTGLTCSDDPAFFDAPGFAVPTNVDSNGPIFALSMLLLARITDGTTNTYLLGEKYLNADNYENSVEGTDNNPTYSGFDWDWQRCSNTVGVSATTPCASRDRKGYSNWQIFGSAHPSTMNMVMCDGAVRAVSFNIDKTTHEHLCDRQDGKAVDASQY